MSFVVNFRRPDCFHPALRAQKSFGPNATEVNDLDSKVAIFPETSHQADDQTYRTFRHYRIYLTLKKNNCQRDRRHAGS